jgi:hypothetical protein
MKLEVGQFARTKLGTIGKIENNSFYIKLRLKKGNYIMIEEDDIVKASYNIIDILECRDIIKLFMEDDIDEEDTNIFELIAINYNDNEIGVFNSDFQIEFFPIENLREILTHEQMEQMAYKVRE